MPDNESPQNQPENSRKVEVYLKETAEQPAALPPETTVDLLEICRFMGAKKRFFALLTALCLLLGAAVPLAVYPFTAQKPEAVAVLTYRYDGAKTGKAPDGSVLNVSDLKSSYVLQKALDAVVLSRTVNISDLAANVTIRGVLTDESLQQLEVLRSLSGNTGTAAQYYEKLAAFKMEYGNRYIVTLQNGFGRRKTVLPDAELETLLQAIVSAYNTYFFEVYAMQTLPVNTLDALDQDTLDYIEQVAYLSDALDSMLAYCLNKKAAFPAYRSDTDMLSFGDIAAVVQVTKDVNVDAVYSAVFNRHVSKDPQKLLTSYEYYIRQEELNLQVAEEKLASTQKLINDYKNEQLVILSGEEPESRASTLTTEYYNGLILQLMQVNEEIAARQKTLTEYRNVAEQFRNAASDETLPDIEAAIAALRADCENLYALLYTHTEELFSTSCYKNSYIGTLITLTQGSKLSSAAGNVAVGAVGGVLVGFAAWFCYGLVRELKKNGKEAEEQN